MSSRDERDRFSLSPIPEVSRKPFPRLRPNQTRSALRHYAAELQLQLDPSQSVIGRAMKMWQGKK